MFSAVPMNSFGGVYSLMNKLRFSGLKSKTLDRTFSKWNNKYAQVSKPVFIKPPAKMPQVEDNNVVKPVEKKPSFRQRMQALWKTYGLLFIGTYSVVYLSTVGSVYCLLDNDLLNISTFGLDYDSAITKVCSYLDYWGIDQFSSTIRNNPFAGKMAISIVVTEISEPIRILAVAACLPKLGKLMGKSTDETASQ